MPFKSLRCACIAYLVTVAAFILPANAGSFDMASNKAYESRIELMRTVNTEYSGISNSLEQQSQNSIAAAAETARDKEYDVAYMDFSKAFRQKNQGYEESATITATKTLLNTFDQLSSALNAAIETVMEFIID